MRESPRLRTPAHDATGVKILPSRRHRRRLALVGAFVTVASTAAAQRAPARNRCAGDTLQVQRDTISTTTVDTLAPGLLYRCILDRRGPWVIHVVEVPLKVGRYTVEGERAFGRFTGRERISDMASRLAKSGTPPLVGINGDFFDLGTGEIENNHVVRGEWVKGVALTDSPHDSVDNPHTQFAIDARGRPLIGRFALAATAIAGRRVQPLAAINFQPPSSEGLVLFTPWFGTHTLGDSALNAQAPTAAANTPVARQDSTRRAMATISRRAHEVTLVRLGSRGDTVLYRAREGAIRSGGGAPIPRQGAVLRGTGPDDIALVDSIARVRGVVKVIERLDATRTPIRTAVGGWPGVVDEGRNVGAFADSLESTFPRFSSARHPRSAAGISADSSTLYLVVVDGRRPWSVGMSLAELGDAMIKLGARDAMNLDGGGSSALWIRGRVVNVPSDAAGERAVGNGVFVFEAKR